MFILVLSPTQIDSQASLENFSNCLWRIIQSCKAQFTNFFTHGFLGNFTLISIYTLVDIATRHCQNVGQFLAVANIQPNVNKSFKTSHLQSSFSCYNTMDSSTQGCGVCICLIGIFRRKLALFSKTHPPRCGVQRKGLLENGPLENKFIGFDEVL